MTMTKEPLSSNSTDSTKLNSYEQDFYAWTQEQAQLLQLGQWQLIDVQNLAEEIEDIGRAEKRELESCLEVLINASFEMAVSA